MMSRNPRFDDDQRRCGRVRLPAARDVARRAAQPARSDRREGRVRHRRLRRVQRHGRRPPGVLVPRARRRGGRAARSRPSRAWRTAASCIRCRHKFIEHAALQCGICTPGFLVAAKALLERNPDPDRRGDPLRARGQSLPLHRLRQDRARGAGSRRRNWHAKRPTARSAQKSAEIHGDERRQHSIRQFTNQEFKVVGTRPPRPDGVDKVTGRARYGADAFAPGQLVGLVLRSPHAHAKIRKIDTTKAEKLQGVKAIITSADLPDLTKGDRGMLDMLENCMARGRALYDGHAVAAVAAIDAETARQALKLIKVDYEGAAARHRRRRGDEAERADRATVRPYDRRRAEADEGVERLADVGVRPRRRGGGLASRPTSSSSAATRPSRPTRATSSRTRASRASVPTARASSG